MKAICQYCKKPFIVYLDKIHKGKYCSRACYQKGRWGNRAIEKNCLTCGKTFKTFLVFKDRKKFCSKECYSKDMKNRTGIKHPRFKYKIAYGRHGRYFAVLSPHHPYADGKGYVMEHRLVMEKHIGRFLKPDEVIHHIDENPKNNDISNLRLMVKTDHDQLHSVSRWTRRKKVKPLVGGV